MNLYLEAMKAKGKADALDLRNRAKDMDGTAIIAEEEKIPDFKNIDYSNHPVGTPVKDGEQVLTLLQPYDASVHTGRPLESRDRWSLQHTKDPKKAKPWVDAFGTSGMWMKGDCYLHKDGKARRALEDNLIHDADALPDKWEVVEI